MYGLSAGSQCYSVSHCSTSILVLTNFSGKLSGFHLYIHCREWVFWDTVWFLWCFAQQSACWNPNTMRWMKVSISVQSIWRKCPFSLQNQMILSMIAWLDLKTGCEGMSQGLAKQALVIMANGILWRWKQPLAFFFFLSRSATPAVILELLLRKTITKLHNAGFIVHCVIFYQGLSNKSLSSSVQSDHESCHAYIGSKQLRDNASFTADFIGDEAVNHLLFSLRCNACFRQSRCLIWRLFLHVSMVGYCPYNLLSLWNDLLDVSNFQYLCTQKVNQDSLENSLCWPPEVCISFQTCIDWELLSKFWFLQLWEWLYCCFVEFLPNWCIHKIPTKYSIPSWSVIWDKSLWFQSSTR